VLGVTTIHDKRIEVDLTNQKVYAYEGNTKIFDFIVSTGKWGPTPTGTFYIWAKVKSQLMEGGSVADNTYYYLPNVPYVQFFYNDQVDKSMGYSFHGAYWHNNFGHPMSHGCINMRIEDAQKLYDWTNPVVTDPNAWSTLASDSDPGTEVVIYGIPPTE
jgi:lipoprotein-anchoring transpeptidase ErfK/SrfK